VRLSVAIIWLFVAGSNPDNRQRFEQIPNLVDVVVPNAPEKDDLRLGRVDVMQVTRPDNAPKTIVKTVLKNVKVVTINAKTKMATVRVPPKDAALICEACRDGHVFLVPHKP
jgi:hypothetical protein